jgi:hypothetical protein
MRGPVLLIGGALLALSIAAWYFADSHGDAVAAPANNAANGPAQTASSSARLADEEAGKRAPFSANGETARQQQLALMQARYERAEQTYTSYRNATRYPHESRPIEEQPDQIKPFDAISEEKTLRDLTGKPIKGLRLRTSQDRVFLSGPDAVMFTIAAVDERGAAVPLLVTRATAGNLPESKTPTQLTQNALEFADNGLAPDAAAADGVFSARLAPAQQGFANLNGTIRVLAQVSVNGEQGVAHFDVIYSPEIPATWLGVREALERGSLNFYLKANVKTAGRYVVSARVDDANGAPFALLQFNEEVAAGEREFKLNLFGALVRDKSPVFPLKLRDIDGFLLIENRFPDRAMMPRQSGVVYTSARYALDKFSPDEWTSEERERYLTEYRNDLDRTRRDADRLRNQ